MALVLSGTDNSVSSPAVQGGTGGTSTGIYYPASNQLALATNGTQALLVDSSQNVGIGTSSPAAKLEAKSTTTNLARIRVTGTGTTAGNYRGYEFASGSGFTGGIFQDESTSNMQFWNNASALMTLDTSGNLGLGVTPSAWGSSWKIIQSNAGAFTNYSNSLIGMVSNMYQNSGGTNTYVISAQSAQYIQFQGSHQWSTAPSGTAGNPITFTQVLCVDKDKTLQLQNATQSSGTGIAFPATQSASSNANTLDDYEEGTWSPTYTNLSGVTTTDSRYTKIGRFVFVTLRFTWTSGSSGGVAVTLPFTSGTASSGNNAGGCGSIFWQGPNAGTFGPISPHISSNSTTITFYKLAVASFVQLNGTDVNGSGYDILCTFSYMVD